MTKKILLLTLCMLLGTACTRINAGYTGIKVNLAGTDRGVSQENIVTGWVFFNPLSTQVFEFPTFTQQFVWTANKNEGSDKDDSITFNSKEGVVLNADVFVAYSFDPKKVPDIFQEFRQTAQVITQTYVRSEVRDAFNRAAGSMPIITIYGEGKGKLQDEALRELRERLGPKGFVFDSISFVGAIRMPDQVHASIDAVIQAQNESAQASARVAQKEAEARQAVAVAQGQYEAAQLQAKANRELAASITPELVQYMQVQKWNGVMPLYTGNNGTVLFSTEKK